MKKPYKNLLDSKFWILDSRFGFTLIEVVIVIGIIVILTSVVLGYSATGRDQVYLSIQKAQVAQVISKAKSLAVSTYNQPNVPCGYGVYFDYSADKYELFSYDPSPCPSAHDLPSQGVNRDNANFYHVQSQNRYSLPPNLIFTSGQGEMDTVFFTPPDPSTFIWVNGSSEPAGSVWLQNKSKNIQAQSVSVNSGGQITF